VSLFGGAEQISSSETFTSQGGIHGIHIWKWKKKYLSPASAKGGFIPDRLPDLTCLAGVKTFIDPPHVLYLPLQTPKETTTLFPATALMGSSQFPRGVKLMT